MATGNLTRDPELREFDGRSECKLRLAVDDGRTRRPSSAEVARVLAGMTYEEPFSAYRSSALSTHELAVAATRFPDRMPLLNDEFERISISSRGVGPRREAGSSPPAVGPCALQDASATDRGDRPSEDSTRCPRSTPQVPRPGRRRV